MPEIELIQDDVMDTTKWEDTNDLSDSDDGGDCVLHTSQSQVSAHDSTSESRVGLGLDDGIVAQRLIPSANECGSGQYNPAPVDDTVEDGTSEDDNIHSDVDNEEEVCESTCDVAISDCDDVGNTKARKRATTTTTTTTTTLTTNTPPAKSAIVDRAYKHCCSQWATVDASMKRLVSDIGMLTDVNTRLMTEIRAYNQTLAGAPASGDVQAKSTTKNTTSAKKNASTKGTKSTKGAATKKGAKSTTKGTGGTQLQTTDSAASGVESNVGKTSTPKPTPKSKASQSKYNTVATSLHAPIPPKRPKKALQPDTKRKKLTQAAKTGKVNKTAKNTTEVQCNGAETKLSAHKNVKHKDSTNSDQTQMNEECNKGAGESAYKTSDDLLAKAVSSSSHIVQTNAAVLDTTTSSLDIDNTTVNATTKAKPSSIQFHAITPVMAEVGRRMFSPGGLASPKKRAISSPSPKTGFTGAIRNGTKKQKTMPSPTGVV